MYELEPQPIEGIVWDEKYRYKRWSKEKGNTSAEETVDDTLRRAVIGTYRDDPDKEALAEAIGAVLDRLFCPAGRELAGAGTTKRVTLVNCYGNATVEDSMATEVGGSSLGIMDALNVASYSLQMGGGIGTDFSTVRPNGAVVVRTNSVSSGILPFMRMWDGMSSTIVSSGSRRGAMMATLRCDHPDLEAYIEVKHEPGVLTRFNTSVLVTDDFVGAVRGDRHWDLGFRVPRADGEHVEVLERNGEPWYVYKRVPARELWDKITESTYHYAEPGVIFIDRVNALNNLNYCETISTTNPCGEQPLPPYGACVLGHINLAVMVKNPFTIDADVDLDRLECAVRVGVRFLDNVIDVTQYPVEAMEKESKNKRRIGLGVMGLANMLQMMRLRYGSEGAILFTRRMMKFIRDAAYHYSIVLAKERGPFPLFAADYYLAGQFVKKLPTALQDSIRKHGIRNGVLLTIAPTGTTSLLFGNVSGGVEPTFDWSYNRKMMRADGITDTIDVEDYGCRLYNKIHGTKTPPIGQATPHYMVTAQELTVRDHVVMQAVCQENVDAAISKTINCPEEMTFEEFKGVYDMAYDMGCKSCTTYRPSAETERVRGSVLSVDKKGAPPAPEAERVPALVTRPRALPGSTFKIKWPNSEHALYVTINDYVGEDGKRRPFEIFINTKDARHQEWITALTRSLSAIFRRGGDVSFVPEELKAVHSTLGGAWVDKKYVPSLVALIGAVVEEHFVELGILSAPIAEQRVEVSRLPSKQEPEPEPTRAGTACPKCGAPTLVHQEGCNTCLTCHYSDCG